MKKTLSILFALSTIVVLADSAQVAARQRWPFSRVVDIDIKCDASNCVDSVLTATYDGAAEPIDLADGLVVGSNLLEPGINHLVWDPLAAGLGENKLKGFTVTATLASFDSRKYLVFDLKERTYAYYPDDPNGNAWNDLQWKTRYLVFRRVPAGVYSLGYTSEQMAHLKDLGASQSYRTQYNRAYALRTIRITKDYYIAIYQTTSGQANAIEWHSETSTGSRGYKNYYYDAKYVETTGYSDPQKSIPAYWRGDPTDAVNGFAWPQDGHQVPMPVCETTVGKSSGCLVGRFRQLMINSPKNLPSNMIVDLATEAQWEIAARAGQSTLLADCGTLTDTKETILEYQYTHYTNKNTHVGMLLPNSWNMYDVMGINYELVINTVNVAEATADNYAEYRSSTRFIDPDQTVDPVGLTGTKDETLYLMCCNAGWSCRGVEYGVFPAYRTVWRQSASAGCAARLCIYLK